MTHYDDYETIPIGGSNPYHKCIHCGISVPQINGRLEGHRESCEYRAKKEQEDKIIVPKQELNDLDYCMYDLLLHTTKQYTIEDEPKLTYELLRLRDAILSFEENTGIKLNISI